MVGLQGVRSLIQGDLLTAVNQFSHASRNLFNEWGKISVAAQGFGAGWQIGKMLDEVLGLSDAISQALVPSIEPVEDLFKKTSAAASTLAQTRFNGLVAELQSITAEIGKVIKATEAPKRREDAERRAEYDADVATIATKPEGPARDRETLARKQRFQEEQRQADEAELKALENIQIGAQAQLDTLRKKGRFEVDVAKKTAEGMDESVRKGGPLAPTLAAAREQRALANKLQADYTAQERALQEALDKVASDRADLESSMRVRASQTRKETAEGVATKTQIGEKEATAADRDRRASETAAAADLKTRLAAAEQQLAAAQAAAAAPSSEDKALADFESTKTPVYKRSIKGREEKAALETYAAQSQTAQTASIANLEAEVAALKAELVRLTPAPGADVAVNPVPPAQAAQAAGAGVAVNPVPPAQAAQAAGAAVNPVNAVNPVPPTPAEPSPATAADATDLKPLKTATDRLATSQSGALDAIIATMQAMKSKYEVVAANIKTGDTY
jgi:hypothetical protein